MAENDRDFRAAAQAGLAYFAVAFAAGLFLGSLRVVYVAPRIGDAGAVLAELPVMLAISWLSALWLIARYALSPALPVRATMGAIGFALLMLAETLLGWLAFGRPLLAQIAAFATWAGALGISGQVIFGLIPMIVGRSGQ